MHEMVKTFIITLWESGINHGDCIACMSKIQYFPNPNFHIPMRVDLVPMHKEQLRALAHALREARLDMTEIRSVLGVDRCRPKPTDKEVMDGLWRPECMTIAEIVEKVKKHYPDVPA